MPVRIIVVVFVFVVVVVFVVDVDVKEFLWSVGKLSFVQSCFALEHLIAQALNTVIGVCLKKIDLKNPSKKFIFCIRSILIFQRPTSSLYVKLIV